SSTAAEANASRSAADATTSPRFCHGSPATTMSTRSSPSAARVSTAATTWPTCTGSNVPPKTPTRSIRGVYGWRVLRRRQNNAFTILERRRHGRVLALTRRRRLCRPPTQSRSLRRRQRRSMPLDDPAPSAAAHVLVRVWLPDRPGALGLVASRIGAVRGDLVGVAVLARGTDVAVDEF